MLKNWTDERLCQLELRASNGGCFSWKEVKELQFLRKQKRLDTVRETSAKSASSKVVDIQCKATKLADEQAETGA
jgi:hypothetical protein